LVGMALAIAMLGGWQLTDWQVGACVAAVALGAALFVLPYLVEYQVRVREGREDRAADLRSMGKHLADAGQRLGAVESRLRSLETAVAEAGLHQAALEVNLAALSEASVSAASGDEPKPVQESDEPQESAGQHITCAVPLQTVAPLERPKRSPRERHGPRESRLLRRAIRDGDHSSAAVSRIIAHKARAQQPGPPTVNEASTPEPVSDPPVSEGLEVLLEEAETSAPQPRSKPRKKDAVLTAAVFIGIGNKPYVRGSGGGLNWVQGVAMEFQEIGKWQWLAPDQLDAAIELQIYRNDEDADRSGKYTLAPGQKLEVHPVF